MLASFPRAVIHVDGDAFFTSVEQALHPALRGRPVVSGKERGIIACASYEAKALGIKRGISLHEARRICPELVVLPSDYESYSLFSKRMFEIMRRYTPEVEEYSIDEGFADISGMRSVFRCSYRELAAEIQRTIQSELDLTVSIGLSITKSLAKIASDFRKPNGITAVEGRYLHLFLPRIPLEDVWGLGPNRVSLLQKYGVRNAWDYISKPLPWIKKMLHKPGVEIWNELRGSPVYQLATTAHKPQASISKCKTFSTPSEDRNFIYAKLIRNLESAFIKLRRHHLCANEIIVSLRTKDYHETGRQVRLNRVANNPVEIIPLVREMFDSLHVPGKIYRSTAIILGGLKEDRNRQYELFEEPLRIEQINALYQAGDRLQTRFGKHCVFLGCGLDLQTATPNARDEPCWRKQHLLKGENTRKRVRLPMLDMIV